MHPNEYQAAALRTECDQEAARKRLTGVHGVANPVLLPVRLIHAAMGISKEAGEILSEIERWLYYGKEPTHEELRLKIKDEIGDVLWYVAKACDAVGLQLEDVMQGNINKLRVRFPEKFDSELAAESARDRQREMRAVATRADEMSTATLQRLTNIFNSNNREGESEAPLKDAVSNAPTHSPESSSGRPQKTRDEVLAAQQTPVGCCNRYADNMACDCLEKAIIAEKSKPRPSHGWVEPPYDSKESNSGTADSEGGEVN